MSKLYRAQSGLIDSSASESLLDSSNSVSSSSSSERFFSSTSSLSNPENRSSSPSITSPMSMTAEQVLKDLQTQVTPRRSFSARAPPPLPPSSGFESWQPMDYGPLFVTAFIAGEIYALFYLWYHHPLWRFALPLSIQLLFFTLVWRVLNSDASRPDSPLTNSNFDESGSTLIHSQSLRVSPLASSSSTGVTMSSLTSSSRYPHQAWSHSMSDSDLSPSSTLSSTPAVFIDKALRPSEGPSSNTSWVDLETQMQVTQAKYRASRRLSVFERVKIKPANLNPFLSKSWKVSLFLRLRISYLGSILLPIRIPMFLLAFFTTWIFALIATVGIDRTVPLTYQSPLNPLRSWLTYWLVRPMMRMVLASVGFLYVRTHGLPACAEDAPVIVSNHIAFLEPVYLCSVFCPSPVGAREHCLIPFLGTIATALQLIGVDRRSASSRQDVVNAIKLRAGVPRDKVFSHSSTRSNGASSIMKSENYCVDVEPHVSDESGASSCCTGRWPQVLIFPEGTCTNGSVLIQFKPGPFLPGKPVQPCLIRYHTPSLHPAWVEAGPGALSIAVRTLCEPISWMSCEFLPVYKPVAQEIRDANMFASNVRAYMAAAMKVPVTDHSFEDVQLQQEAMANHLPPELAVMEFSRVKSALRIDLNTVKKQLARFREMDKDGDGLLDIEEFEAGLGFQTPNAVVRHLFNLLDVQETGRLDFREYIIGMGALAPEQSTDSSASTSAESANISEQQEALIRLAFRVFDLDDVGLIRLSVLRQSYQRAFPDLSTAQVDENFAILRRLAAERVEADSALENQMADEELFVDYAGFRTFALQDPRYVQRFRETFWRE